jgi:hypothetical protein
VSILHWVGQYPVTTTLLIKEKVIIFTGDPEVLRQLVLYTHFTYSYLVGRGYVSITDHCSKVGLWDSMLYVDALYNVHNLYSMVNMDGNSTEWYGKSCDTFQITVVPTNICVGKTCGYPWSWYARQDMKEVRPEYKYMSLCNWLITLNIQWNM